MLCEVPLPRASTNGLGPLLSLRRVQLGLALAMGHAPRAVAQADSTWSYGVETAVRSGHADRGFLISDRAVFQPVVWASWRRWEGYLWSNIALADATDGTRPEIAEVGLGRVQVWHRTSIAPSVRMYLYQDPVHHDSDHSIEAWLELTRPVGPLTLFTRQSLDLLDDRGGYFGTAGAEASAHPVPSVSFGGSLEVGWGNATFHEYWTGVATSALSHVGAEGWLHLHPAPRVYLGPHLEFSSIIDRRVRAGDLFRPSYVLLGFFTGVEF